MSQTKGEVRDVPFLGNDMNDSLPTTGRPLDAADGPGKADAEMGVESETGRYKAAQAGVSGQQDENPPKVVADEGQPGG